MVPYGSSPVTHFALASAMRKTKRLRRRLGFPLKEPDNKGTSEKTPMATSEANPKTRAATTSSGQTSTSHLTTEAATQSVMVKERRLIENVVFEDDMADLAEDVTFEDAALSKIPRQSDEPVLNQEGIKDDAKAEVV